MILMIITDLNAPKDLRSFVPASFVSPEGVRVPPNPLFLIPNSSRFYGTSASSLEKKKRLPPGSLLSVLCRMG
jgi:hypothetical protein